MSCTYKVASPATICEIILFFTTHRNIAHEDDEGWSSTQYSLRPYHGEYALLGASILHVRALMSAVGYSTCTLGDSCVLR